MQHGYLYELFTMHENYKSDIINVNNGAGHKQQQQ